MSVQQQLAGYGVREAALGAFDAANPSGLTFASVRPVVNKYV